MKERKTKLCVFIILSATVSLPFLCFPLKCKLERWCVLSRLFERQERVRSGVNGALELLYQSLLLFPQLSVTMIVFLRHRSLLELNLSSSLSCVLRVCCLSDNFHFSKAQIVWVSLYTSVTNCTSFCDCIFKFNPGLRSLHVSECVYMYSVLDEVCDKNSHIK